jgi:hypothetical protein
VPLLSLQRAFHEVRAEHKLALPFAEKMEKVGEARAEERWHVSERLDALRGLERR